MSRARDERREKAYKMFKRAGGEKKVTDIAHALGVPASTVRGWKVKDGWEARLEQEKSAPNRGGAPRGNKNARGNHGGAPEGNQNSVRHGAYARMMSARMSEDEREVFGECGYAGDIAEALKLEINAINVQQVRLMTRLSEVQARLSEMSEAAGADADADADIKADVINGYANEIYTIEHALDRASGRKVRILQMLQSAQEAQQDVKVVFGFDALGEPEHEEQ